MDFFGILFDMKNGKKVPYSKTYFDTMLADNLAGVTTLTGTLPLTFTTSETALRSWTIYGADIEHVKTASGKSITFHTDEDKLRDWTIYGNAEGVGERTKNLLKITRDSITLNGVTLTVDKENGTVTANGKAKATVSLGLEIDASTYYGDFYASINTAGGSSNTFYAYLFDSATSAYCTKWDGKTLSGNIFANASEKVKVISGHRTRLFLQIVNGYQCDNVIFKPMLRAANTTPEFIPYGYEIPLTISQDGQTDKNYNIFIGDSPMTEGETVSKLSTGVDIATADGNNTITTSLYNQPDMSITYNEFTGVGILTANLFMIALQLKAGGQTLNVFNTLMNKPLRAGETLTSEQTGQTINTVAGVENKLSPAPEAASYGGSFDMTIKYKE